jgi:hypothetical protein
MRPSVKNVQLNLAACHWLGRLAKYRRTGTRGSSDGSHLLAKLVSQLRGTAFGRNILVSLDDQHTQAHARTHDQRLRLRVSAHSLNRATRAWSIAIVDFPARLALLTPSSSCCPAITVAAVAAPTQPSQAPSHSVDCSFQRCAALRSCLAR